MICYLIVITGQGELREFSFSIDELKSGFDFVKSIQNRGHQIIDVWISKSNSPFEDFMSFELFDLTRLPLN